MPKLERKIEIESTPEKIYNIVKDGINTPKWNLTVSAITFEDDKTKLETDFGAMKIVNVEYDINKYTTWYLEESDMNSIGYILTPKKEATEVTIWTEYDNKKLSKLFKKNADQVLLGLKNYAEYLEDGGDPNHYKKWEILTTP